MSANRFVVLSLMVCGAIGCGAPPPPPKSTGPKTTEPPKPETVKDQGIHGELHKANVGSIVFATQEIPKEAGESFPNTTEVSIGDSVWARAYFAKSPQNTYAGRGIDCPLVREWRLRVRVDGGDAIPLDSKAYKPAEWNTRTTLTPRSAEDNQWLWGEKRVSYPTDAESVDMKLAQLFLTLTPGVHDLTFEVKVACKKSAEAKEQALTFAKGLLKVKVDDEGKKKLIDKVGPYVVPNALPEEAEVTRLRKAITKNITDGKILDFRVIEPAWRVKRNDAGVPRNRAILALTIVDRAGKCEVAGTEIKEEALGGASFGQPTFAEPPAEANIKKTPIPCENAKKNAK